jgi:hypothetical protein
MNRGLTDADMAQEAHADGESIRADSIAAVRRIVLLSLIERLREEWEAGGREKPWTWGINWGNSGGGG